MYADIFIENNYKKIDTLYTYLVPKKMDVEVGCRVQIPFGKGVRVGIVLHLYAHYEGDYEQKLKEIEQVLDFSPILDEEAIALALWMKEQYMLGYSKAFAPLLPPGNLKKIRRKVVLSEGLSKEEQNLYSWVKDADYDRMNPEKQRQVAKLVKEGICRFYYLSVTEVKPKLEKRVRLISSAREKLNHLGEKQQKVVDYLEKVGEVSRQELLSELNISSSPLNTLVKNQIVEIVEREVYREPYSPPESTPKLILNEEQRSCLHSILSTDREVSLLHGLTGSGKTEIYLQLTEHILQEGGEVIVLVPEIGLTPQMIQRFQRRFGEKVSIIHSKLSAGERYDQYRKIKNGEVRIVVGVRSAVFAPFSNCKLIILDEEHDSSYDFHDSLKYDTREVAIYRMRGRGKVLLGSATPSVESFYQVQRGEYHLAKLTKRAVKEARLPKTEIVDLRQELLQGNLSIFSRLLKREIAQALQRREQVILFLNRRGYSHFVSCRSCGHVVTCEHCDISMTYHRSKNRMICHYCGATKPIPTQCPNCGSKYIKQFGIGTEQVEEEIHKLFPQARTLRMDRDTTRAKDAYDQMYEAIQQEQVDVIIGTQMISKGFDFENVTLVGVIASDLSLYVADYRAAERTFQLITQVAGRAGRAKKEGKVIIQSYDPGNYTIQCAAAGEYSRFYQEELAERKAYNYPPFVRLIHFTLSSKEEDEAQRWARGFLYHIGKAVEGLHVQGTNIIALPKIKNIYRAKFTLKVLPQEEELLRERIKRVVMKSKIDEQRDIFLDIEF